MERGMPRSGRGNPGSQHLDSGPLMTEHLHNLDLELELLKRKREMLEQQQQQIDEQRSSRQRPYNFDQPRYFEQERSNPQESSSNRNFSHLYDPADAHDFIPLTSDRKRRGEYQWTNDLPNKRFSNPKPGDVAKSFGSRLGPLLPAPRTEHHQSSGSFQRGRFEIDTNRDLLLKNEPQALMALNMRRPPLNLRHVQKPIRKDFKPTKVTKSKSKKPANEPNSRPVSERKDLVAQASQLVKKVNEAMVLRAGREPSPQLTGRLELALGQILKDLKLKYGERSSHAHIFQQQSLLRLMKQMIRERIRSVMLGKFVGPCKDVIDAYRAAYPVATDEDIVGAALEAEPNAPNKKFDIKLVETDDPEKYFKANTEKLLDLKLREMCNKLIEIYTSPLSNTNDESNKDKDVKKEKVIDFTTDLTEEDIKKCDEKDSDVKLEDYKISIDKLDEMIRWRLPRVLKKFIPFIIKVLNIDQMYEATKASLIMKTNDKAMAIAKKLDKADLGPTRTWAPPTVNKPQDGNTDGQSSTQTGIQNYYVKIFGRPLLPKRKIMQQFLDQFQPKSVKKHKALHNLLYVVFVNKDNFDKILAEDGVVIGKSTLEIKLSEQRPNPKKTKQDSNDDEVQIIEDVNKTINLDDTLPSINDELDEQITDLLTSIRQAEEEQAKETEENDKAVMEVDDLVGNENDTIPESNTEGESQNKSNEVSKDVEIPDEVDNIISEGLNEPNEAQDNVAKADKVNYVVGEGQNEPNDIQKDDGKAGELNDIVSEGDNEKSTEIEEETTTDQKEPEKESNEHKELEDSGKKTSDNTIEEFEKGDVVATLKSDKDSGRSTPIRTSARLANITPSTIRTRRASRLEQ